MRKNSKGALLTGILAKIRHCSSFMMVWLSGAFLFPAAMLIATEARAADPVAPAAVRILFVDTGNTGRSVSAEALSRALIKKQKLKIAVRSRALEMDPEDVKPETNAAKLLRDRGIDVSGHVATQLSATDASQSDLILTMTAKHKEKLVQLFPDAKGRTFTIAEYATGNHTDVFDAWGKPMPVYIEMFRQLEIFLPAVLAKSVAVPR